MAAFAQYITRPSSQVSLDRKASSLYLDDLDTTFDDSLLDSTATIMSPADRRDSFAESNAPLFSPQTSMWDNFSAPQPADRNLSISTNPFFEHAQNNNPFTRLGPSEAASYGQQPSAWPPFERSGSRTPTTAHTFESFDAQLEHGASNGFMGVDSSAASTFAGLSVQNNVRPSSVFPPAQPSVPTSPRSGHEWMTMAAQEMDNRPMPKRMRPNTPPGRSYSPFPRREGIRKKNARFEIPAERSLLNIDNLIANSTNDEELKELKQQKRLLRNRQAALDSRQRKKKHTEELEEEKKIWTDRMQLLEEEVAALRMQAEGHDRERAQWQHEHMQTQQQIETLVYEKEDLVCGHTRETGELRKKIFILTEKLEATTLSNGIAPSDTTTFADFTTNMDGLNMGTNEWDCTFVNDDYDFCMDNSTPSSDMQPSTQATSNHSMVLATRKKEAAEASSDSDKPVASGLLLMLLLCGAFVASNASGKSAPAIPRMPDDVRAASATVLDSIFKDAGVAPSSVTPQNSQNLIVNHVDSHHRGLSANEWPKSTLSGTEFASLSASGITDNLGQLHAQFIGTTRDQEAEQLFSMTPSQYNSLTSADFTRSCFTMPDSSHADGDESASPRVQPSQQRHNLAETLRAMHEHSKGDTAAEVYTRSLLWDKIPSEVVREFKRMVEEGNPVGEEGGSKVET